MTQERNTKQAEMDENYTHMTNFKDRWQNLKVFEFQRKKTAGRMPVTTAKAMVKPVIKQIYS